jgi:DNA polymerase IV
MSLAGFRPLTHFYQMRQYLKTGMIEETQVLQSDPMYDILAEFTKVYGIGPKKARQLYDMGMRSFDDLKEYFSRELELQKSKDVTYTESMLHSLALHDEFNVKWVKSSQIHSSAS